MLSGLSVEDHGLDVEESEEEGAIEPDDED